MEACVDESIAFLLVQKQLTAQPLRYVRRQLRHYLLRMHITTEHSLVNSFRTNLHAISTTAHARKLLLTACRHLRLEADLLRIPLELVISTFAHANSTIAHACALM